MVFAVSRQAAAAVAARPCVGLSATVHPPPDSISSWARLTRGACRPRPLHPVSLVLPFARQAHRSSLLSAVNAEADTTTEREQVEAPGGATASHYASAARAAVWPTTSHREVASSDASVPYTELDHCDEIYVGNVPYEAKGSDIYELFSRHASVHVVSLPAEPTTARPRGYAFVRLKDASQLLRVVEETNGVKLFGRPLIVKPNRRPKVRDSAEDRRNRTVSVTNLPKDITAEEVGRHYLSFGEITEVRVPRNFKTGEPAGYASVEFSESFAAEKAVEMTNQSQFLGRFINVQLARNCPLHGNGLPREATQLYIQNLSYHTTRKQLQTFYESFGQIVFASVAVRGVNSRSFGFGFVKFENAHAAREAKETTDGKIFQGRQLKVSYSTVDINALSKSDKDVDQKTVVHVKDLDPSCKPAELDRFFSRFGLVEDVYIDYQSVSPSGFVRFSSRKEAQWAVNETTGVEFMDKLIFPRIYVPEDWYADASLSTDGAASIVKSKIAVVRVSGLHSTLTTAELAEHFRSFGEVTDASLSWHEDSGERTLHGIVHFKSYKHAELAVESADQSSFLGRIITVQLHMDLSDSGSRFSSHPRSHIIYGDRNHLVYVRGLPFTTKPDEVREFFSQFGKVEDVALPVRRDSGLPAGYGFVQFASARQADLAVTRANNATFQGKILLVAKRDLRMRPGGIPAQTSYISTYRNGCNLDFAESPRQPSGQFNN